MLAGECQSAVREGADSGEPLIIAVDDGLPFILRDAEPASDSPGRAPIENGKVDRLRLVAGVPVDPPEQFLGCHAVDVDAGAERLFELWDIGHVRREPKLDLAIVSR